MFSFHSFLFFHQIDFLNIINYVLKYTNFIKIKKKYKKN
jgi:hypothetical protein